MLIVCVVELTRQLIGIRLTTCLFTDKENITVYLGNVGYVQKLTDAR